MKPSKLLTALNVLSKVQSSDEQTSCHLPPPPVSDFHISPQMVFLSLSAYPLSQKNTLCQHPIEVPLNLKPSAACRKFPFIEQHGMNSNKRCGIEAESVVLGINA
jgi:hypothetical protein